MKLTNALAPILALILLLFGCGGAGSDAPSSGADDASTPTEEVAPEEEKEDDDLAEEAGDAIKGGCVDDAMTAGWDEESAKDLCDQ